MVGKPSLASAVLGRAVAGADSSAGAVGESSIGLATSVG